MSVAEEAILSQWAESFLLPRIQLEFVRMTEELLARVSVVVSETQKTSRPTCTCRCTCSRSNQLEFSGTVQNQIHTTTEQERDQEESTRLTGRDEIVHPCNEVGERETPNENDEGGGDGEISENQVGKRLLENQSSDGKSKGGARKKGRGDTAEEQRQLFNMAIRPELDWMKSEILRRVTTQDGGFNSIAHPTSWVNRFMTDPTVTQRVQGACVRGGMAEHVGQMQVRTALIHFMKNRKKADTASLRQHTQPLSGPSANPHAPLDTTANQNVPQATIYGTIPSPIPYAPPHPQPPLHHGHALATEIPDHSAQFEIDTNIHDDSHVHAVHGNHVMSYSHHHEENVLEHIPHVDVHNDNVGSGFEPDVAIPRAGAELGMAVNLHEYAENTENERLWAV